MWAVSQRNNHENKINNDKKNSKKQANSEQEEVNEANESQRNEMKHERRKEKWIIILFTLHFEKKRNTYINKNEWIINKYIWMIYRCAITLYCISNISIIIVYKLGLYIFLDDHHHDSWWSCSSWASKYKIYKYK